jgi:hypothetical protein
VGAGRLVVHLESVAVKRLGLLEPASPVLDFPAKRYSFRGPGCSSEPGFNRLDFILEEEVGDRGGLRSASGGSWSYKK